MVAARRGRWRSRGSHGGRAVAERRPTARRRWACKRDVARRASPPGYASWSDAPEGERTQPLPATRCPLHGRSNRPRARRPHERSQPLSQTASPNLARSHGPTFDEERIFAGSCRHRICRLMRPSARGADRIFAGSCSQVSDPFAGSCRQAAGRATEQCEGSPDDGAGRRRRNSCPTGSYP